jgi:signal transduction histidine kinase
MPVPTPVAMHVPMHVASRTTTATAALRTIVSTEAMSGTADGHGVHQMDSDLTFPDNARSELERTIDELVTHAQSVLRTQGRLRDLLDANRHIVERLDLPSTLRAVVEAGVELVGAGHGALSLTGDGGTTEHVEADGIAVGIAGRTAVVVTVGASVGLGTGAPPPRSPRADAGHLDVPIRVRGAVLGHLSLVAPDGGRFTLEDEQLVAALAATAGVALENARLFDEARRREQWTTAMADISAALLTDAELDDVLTTIIDRVAAFVDADLVCVAVPTATPGRVRIVVATGAAADGVRGRDIAVAGTLAGRAMRDGRSAASEDPLETMLLDGQPPLGPSIAIPLRAPGGELGALLVSRRPGTERFSASEIAMADEFGRQTSVALAVSRGRRDRHRLELAEERSRIARDLHDHVIQRLFASGLALQGLATIAPVGLRAGIDDQVDSVDAAIREVRTAVFALGAVARMHAPTTRDRLLAVVSEIRPALAVPPQITFDGRVDLDVHGALSDDVVAVVRESLTNVARHAPDAASRISVAVDPGPRVAGPAHRTVRVVVDDDGPGPGDTGRRSGTANLAVRAQLRHGTFDVDAGPDGGTRVTWTSPIEDEPATERRT